VRTTNKLGEKCPYAHHLCELEFPETVHFRMNAADNMKKKIQATIETEKVPFPFKPSSVDLWKNPKAPGDDETRAALAVKKKKLAHYIKKMQDSNLTEYLAEMKSIQKNIEGTSKKIKFNLDENFCKKFGSLKKASVLDFYGRTNEAFTEIANAAKIV